MANLPLRYVSREYDYLMYMALGEVQPEGIDLTFDRKTSIAQFVADPSIVASEMSFSAHLIRLSKGDRSIVGIPWFAYRAFRQRCFFIRRGSGLKTFEDLAGKRVGTNAWPDSGNTWSRALLRDAGVDIEGIKWTVGPVDDLNSPKRYTGAEPAWVSPAPQGRLLKDMLAGGDLDALMYPEPPKGFYSPNSPIVRLLPNYREVEREYYLRTKILPGQHIVGIRRAAFEQNPWIGRSLYDAVERAKLAWFEKRRSEAELLPWLLPEIEETSQLFGYDWQPNGVEPNRHVIKALCEEEFAQKLIAQPLDPDSVFTEYEQSQKG